MKKNLTPSLRQDANDLLAILSDTKSILENHDFGKFDPEIHEKLEVLRLRSEQIRNRVQN